MKNELKEGEWITDGSFPKNNKLVIAQYSGLWPKRSNSGIAEVYAIDNKWIVPKKVIVEKWMYYPHEDSELWFKNGELPDTLVVVIAHYKENYSEEFTGVRDLYTYSKEWFNLPEETEIDRWMYIPE